MSWTSRTMHTGSWKPDTEKHRQRHSEQQEFWREFWIPYKAWLLPRLNFVYLRVYRNFGYMHFRLNEFSGIWHFEDMNFRVYETRPFVFRSISSIVYNFSFCCELRSVAGLQLGFFCYVSPRICTFGELWDYLANFKNFQISQTRSFLYFSTNRSIWQLSGLFCEFLKFENLTNLDFYCFFSETFFYFHFYKIYAKITLEIS